MNRHDDPIDATGFRRVRLPAATVDGAHEERPRAGKHAEYRSHRAPYAGEWNGSADNAERVNEQ